MSEHRMFKTPLRVVIMMVIGLNYVLQDLLLAFFVGISIYAMVVRIEQFLNDRR